MQEWFILLINVLVGVSSQVFLKKAVVNFAGVIGSRPHGFFRFLFDQTLYIALFLCVVNFLIYMYLLKSVRVGYLFSLYVSLSIVALFVYDYIFEKIEVKNAATVGIAMIIVGVVLIESAR